MAQLNLLEEFHNEFTRGLENEVLEAAEKYIALMFIVLIKNTGPLHFTIDVELLRTMRDDHIITSDLFFPGEPLPKSVTVFNEWIIHAENNPHVKIEHSGNEILKFKIIFQDGYESEITLCKLKYKYIFKGGLNFNTALKLFTNKEFNYNEN